MWCRIHHW